MATADRSDGWAALDAELGQWQQDGQTPTFWWRDDDARAPSPALDQLLALSDRHAVPVHLSVIPDGLSPDLAPRLHRAGQVLVLQHGFAHRNHEPPGSGASEFGASRAAEAMRADLLSGWRILCAAGLPHLQKVLAAPWNRLGARALQILSDEGYVAVSGFPDRVDAQAPLPQVHIHVDPIRWRAGPRFRGTRSTLNTLVSHLHARRTGTVPRDQATGLATHHLQTDPESWVFLDRLLQRLTRPETTAWPTLPQMLHQGGLRPNG